MGPEFYLDNEVDTGGSSTTPTMDWYEGNLPFAYPECVGEPRPDWQARRWREFVANSQGARLRLRATYTKYKEGSR